MILAATTAGDLTRRLIDDLLAANEPPAQDDAEGGAATGDPQRVTALADALSEAAHSPLGSLARLAQTLGDPCFRQGVAPDAWSRGLAHEPAGAGACAESSVKTAFQQEFAAKAADKDSFDAFMRQVFGDHYDKNLAEQYRQQALHGDFSFLPEVKFVDAATLQGGKGAYNEAEGVVYINRDLAASDPDMAAQVFVEEAGAHLDAKLNTVDTAGDEGEMFRRVLGGEKLSAREVEAIRNDDDHGTITVDGKKVDVEFWFGEDFVDAVGGAVKDVANGVVDAVKEVGGGVVGAVKDVGQGLWEMTGGFVGNLFQGNIGEAFSSVTRGLDHAIFQSTERLYSGVVKGVQGLVNGVTDALGPIGKPIRWATDRLFDIGQTALDTAFGLARDAFRVLPDIAVGFVSDMERAVKLAADGRWGDAAKEFGMAFVHVPVNAVGHVVDAGARVLQAAASIGQTAIGLEPPARGLTEDERAYLKTIYGDSVDLDMVRVKPGGPLNNAMAPHTVGNTVYMPANLFDANGKLTAQGLDTLGHEVGHVWQNQNGGGDYIHNALFAQLWGSITEGSRDAAYDWREALRNGESFESMNDEERAKVMEDIGAALKDDGAITATDGGYTAAEVAFLVATAKEIRSGEGAG